MATTTEHYATICILHGTALT